MQILKSDMGISISKMSSLNGSDDEYIAYNYINILHIIIYRISTLIFCRTQFTNNTAGNSRGKVLLKGFERQDQ